MKTMGTMLRVGLPLLSLVVASWALFYVVQQTGILQSDLEARTRPYLALEELIVCEKGDNSVCLTMDVTNYGVLPAMNIEITITGDDGDGYVTTPQIDTVPGTFVGEPNTILFPGRHNLTQFCMNRTDYDEIITKAAPINFELTYSCAERSYWYEAQVALQPDGNWTINSDRGN